MQPGHGPFVLAPRCPGQPGVLGGVGLRQMLGRVVGDLVST